MANGLEAVRVHYSPVSESVTIYLLFTGGLTYDNRISLGISPTSVADRLDALVRYIREQERG